MISAIDTSVILDILTEDKKNANASENILQQAIFKGKLIICECVIAEIYPAFNNINELRNFISDLQIEFIPSNIESAELAGSYFSSYLKRGGKAKRVLPDFLIGAHAYLLSDCLIARDRGYLRDYFKNLKVIDPSVS